MDLGSRVPPPVPDPEQGLEVLLGPPAAHPLPVPHRLHRLLLLLRVQLGHLLKVPARLADVDELADHHRLRQTGHFFAIILFGSRVVWQFIVF